MNLFLNVRKTHNCILMFLLLFTLPLLMSVATAEQIDFHAFIEDNVLPIMNQSSDFFLSEEEFDAICAVIEESGRQLSLDASQSHSKDGILRALLSDEFGGTLGEWRVEDQAWYANLCVSLGLIESSELCVPQEGEISQQDAIEIATQYLLSISDIPNINDPSVWCCTSQYVVDSTWRARWYIEWSTVDPQDSVSYQVQLSPYGEIDKENSSPNEFYSAPVIPNTTEQQAYLTETSITQEDAIELAWSAVKAEYELDDTFRALYEVTCNLATAESRPIWKVTFWRNEEDLYSIRVDAQTGNILDVYDASNGVG